MFLISVLPRGRDIEHSVQKNEVKGKNAMNYSFFIYRKFS